MHKAICAVQIAAVRSLLLRQLDNIFVECARAHSLAITTLWNLLFGIRMCLCVCVNWECRSFCFHHFPDFLMRQSSSPIALKNLLNRLIDGKLFNSIVFALDDRFVICLLVLLLASIFNSNDNSIGVRYFYQNSSPDSMILPNWKRRDGLRWAYLTGERDTDLFLRDHFNVCFL